MLRVHPNRSAREGLWLDILLFGILKILERTPMGGSDVHTSHSFSLFCYFFLFHPAIFCRSLWNKLPHSANGQDIAWRIWPLCLYVHAFVNTLFVCFSASLRLLLTPLFATLRVFFSSFFSQLKRLPSFCCTCCGFFSFFYRNFFSYILFILFLPAGFVPLIYRIFESVYAHIDDVGLSNSKVTALETFTLIKIVAGLLL